MKVHIAFLLLLSAAIAAHTSALNVNQTYYNQQNQNVTFTFTIRNDVTSGANINAFNITNNSASFIFGSLMSNSAELTCSINGSLINCTGANVGTGSSTWVAANVNISAAGNYTLSATTLDSAAATYSPTALLLADWTAPTITGIAPWVGSTTFWASWNTSETTNSSLAYGTTAALGSYNNSSTMVLNNHNLSIAGLTPNATYYYNVTSCDAAANCVVGGPYDFTTVYDNVTIVVANGSTTTSSTYTMYVNITNTGTNTTSFLIGYNQTLAWTITPQYPNITLATAELRTIYFTVVVPVAQYGVPNNITVLLNSSWGRSFASAPASINVTNIVYNFALALVRPWTAVVSPYKNFTLGTAYPVNLTITNTGNINETYTINYSLDTLQNASWSVYTSTNTTSLIYGNSTNVTVYITEAVNSTENATLTLNVTSSSATMKNITVLFAMARIYVSIPANLATSTIYSSKDSLYFSINATCEVGDNVTENITAVTRAWSIFPPSNSTTLLTGLCNSNNTCNVSTAGLDGSQIYTLVVFVSDNRSHNGSSSMSIVVPRTVSHGIASTITANQGTYLTVAGSAYYNGLNSSVAAVSYGVLQVTGVVNCSSLVSGAFNVGCGVVPETTGMYDLTVTITGLWGVTQTSTVKLNVVKPGTSTTTPALTILPISPVTLNAGETGAFTAIVNSTYNYNVPFNMTVNESGSIKHFNVTYEGTSLTVPAYGTKQVEVALSAYAYPKPGNYTVIVKLEGRDVSQSMTVSIPEPGVVKNEVNKQRYIETTADNVSTVTIVLVNKKSTPVDVNVTEAIPKSVATNVSEITFSVNYSQVIEPDPIVAWYVTLDSGEEFKIEYSVNKSIENVAFAEPIVETKAAASNASQQQNATTDQKKTPTLLGGTSTTITEAGGGDSTFLYLLLVVIAVAAIVLASFFTQVKQLEPVRNLLLRLMKRPAAPTAPAVQPQAGQPAPAAPAAPARAGIGEKLKGITGIFSGLTKRKPPISAAPQAPAAPAAAAKGAGAADKIAAPFKKLAELLRRKPPKAVPLPPPAPAQPPKQQPFRFPPSS